MEKNICVYTHKKLLYICIQSGDGYLTKSASGDILVVVLSLCNHTVYYKYIYDVEEDILHL